MSFVRRFSSVVWVFVFLAWGHMASAKTLYVETWGTNTNPCSKSLPCESPRSTSNLLGKNDKLIVGPGVYGESLPISINGAFNDQTGVKIESSHGRTATIIQISSVGSSVVHLDQSKVRFGKAKKGFTIRANASDSPGIIVAGSGDSARIEGNRVTGTTTGIRVEGAEKVQIKGNLIDGNTEIGIDCDDGTGGCPRALIQSNTISDNATGISIGLGEKVSILKNYIRDHVDGGIFAGSGTQGIRVKDNAVTTVTSGDAVNLSELDGGLLQGNISAGALFPHNGYTLSQSTQTQAAPRVVSNLAVWNQVFGMELDLMDFTLERNTSVVSGDSAYIVASTATAKKVKNNNALAGNDNAAGGCFFESDATLTFSNQFFALRFGQPTPALPDTAIACGTNPPTGTVATKPNKTNTSRASAL